MLTFLELQQAVSTFKEAVRLWELADEPMSSYNGRPRKAVSQQVEEAATTLFDATDTMDVEPESRELTLAVDVFEDAFVAWAEKCQQGHLNIDPQGGTEVWGPYNELLQKMERHQYRKAEPIQQLLHGGVGHRQIAMIYGWYLGDPSDRMPDLERVQREIRKPGSEYKPDEWRHPYDLRWEAAVDAAWEKRESRFQEEKAVATVKKEKKIAPEPLDALIRLPGMTPKQVAKMKGITEDDVLRRAQALGESMGGTVLIPTNPSERARTEELQRETAERQDFRARAEVNTYPELGDDYISRVQAMHGDGNHPAQIVARLCEAFPELNFEGVELIIASSSVA